MRAANARWACLAALLAAACGRTATLEPRPPPPRFDAGPAACLLAVTPDALDFGDATPGVVTVRAVTLQDQGAAGCDLTALHLAAATDSHFTLESPDGGTGLVIPPGGTAFARVRFEIDTPRLPFDRTGELLFASNDAAQPTVSVPLAAHLHLCALTASPNPLNFGNVMLNTTAQGTLTLANSGNETCDVTGLGLGPDTDPLFSFAGPSTAQIAPGDQVGFGVSFSASDSAPPHLRTGSIELQVNDPAAPSQTVPLSAYVNTICTEVGQYIYTVDSNYTFARFDPKTLSSTDIATLTCPTSTGATPFSMNLDQKGTAWVLYSDGAIYNVNPLDASCTATSYVSGQHGFVTFGMGSVFDADAGTDTLYLATDVSTGGELGTLDLSNLVVGDVGPISVGSVELAGTGDGELWAYSPSEASVTQNAELARLDPATGATLEQYDLIDLNLPPGQGAGWAVKFYGGSFYIFQGADVWQVPRTTLVPGNTAPTSPPVKVLSTPGRDIVGAGVSTCAPVQ